MLVGLGCIYWGGLSGWNEGEGEKGGGDIRSR
jgi:hypothetical protein